MSSSLFTIERVEEHRYRAVIDPLHNIFSGHFPEQPVVPGVCTIGMIKECVGETLGREIIFCAIKECKFLSVITPEHKSVDVDITIKSGDTEEHQIAAVVTMGESVMMKLKATAI